MDPVVILQGAGPLTPGGQQTLNLRVRNQGRRVEGYRLTVLGPLSPHATVAQPELSVYPGREESADIVVSLPEGATTPTGSLPVGVLVQSLVEAESSAVAEVDMSIGGVSGLTVRALQTMRKARWSARYPIELVNRGNTPARVCLVGHDPAGELIFQIPHDVIDIPPGGSQISNVKVKARHPFLRGSAQMTQFEIATYALPFGTEKPFPGAPARPGDEFYRQVHLQMQRLPVISKGLMLLVGLLLLGIAALVVWSLRGGPKDEALGFAPPPAPAEVRLASVQPDSLVVEWEPVAAASGYEVWLTNEAGDPQSRTSSEPIDALSTSFKVEALEPEQAVCFTVFAVAPEDGGRSPGGAAPCATTPGEAELAAPSELAEVSQEGTKVTLTWVEPAEPEGIEYQVFVDGSPSGSPVDAPGRPVDLGEPGEYAVYVVAQTEDGLESSPSNEITVVIAAADAASGDGTGAGTAGGAGGAGGLGGVGGGTGGGAGGGTAAPAALNAAVLRSVLPGDPGANSPEGVQATLQQRLDDAGFNELVEVTTTDEFPFANGKPTQPGFALVYVETADVAAATALCGELETAGIECDPFALTGAA